MKLTRLIVIGILATAGTALAQASDLDPDTDRVVVPPPPPAPAPGIGDPIAPRAITPADDNDYAASGFVDRDGDGLDDRYEADRGRVGDRPRYEPPSKIGMGLVVGGGVTDFITDRASESVQVGPEWAARVNVGTRSFLGAEAAYTGTTQTLSTLGGGQSALMSHGVQTLARVNFTRAAIQPYLAAGIGYRRYNLINSNATATSDVQDSANVAEIPAATGIALRAKGFIFDGRFNVGVPVSTPALRNMGNRVEATTWGVNGNVGFEF